MSESHPPVLEKCSDHSIPDSLIMAFFSGSRLLHQEMARVHLYYLHHYGLFSDLDVEGYFNVIDQLAVKGWLQKRETDAQDIAQLVIHPQLVIHNNQLLSQLTEPCYQGIILSFCYYYDEIAFDYNNWLQDRNNEPLLLAITNLNYEIGNLHYANELMITHRMDYYIVFSVLENWYLFNRRLEEGLDLCQKTKDMLDHQLQQSPHFEDQSFLEDYLYVCHGLSTYQMRIGEFSASKETLKDAIRDFHFNKFQDDPETTLLGDLHRSLGETLIDLKDYKTAERHFLLAEELYEGRASDVQLGMLYSDLSDTYRDQDKSVAAYQYGLKAYDHYQKESAGIAMGAILNGLGVLAREHYHFPQSVEFLSKAIEIFKDYQGTSDLGDAYNDLGLTFLAMEDLEKAKLNFKLGVEYSLQAGNKRTEMVSLGNLAMVRFAEQNEDEVNDYLETVELGLDDLNESKRLISLLCALTDIVINRKQFSKAAKLLDNAEEITLLLSEDIYPRYHVLVAHLRGSILAAQQKLGEAITTWQPLLALTKRIGDRYLQVFLHKELAWVWAKMGQVSPARRHIKEMLDAASELGEFTLAERFCDAGLIERILVDSDRAMEFFRSAEISAMKANIVPVLADIHFHIGWVDMDYQRLDQAHDRFQMALSLFEELGSKNGIGKCHYYLGRLFEAKDTFELAKLHFQKAKSYDHHLRNNN